MRPLIAPSVWLALFFCTRAAFDPIASHENDLYLPGHTEKGVLTAVLVSDVGVFSIEEGQPSGFDYQLLKWYQSDAKLKLRILFAPNSNAALDSVKLGKADVACGNILTQEASDVRFSTPLMTGPVYWISVEREEIYPGDTLYTLANSPLSVSVTTWATENNSVTLSPISTLFLFRELFPFLRDNPGVAVAAPKWMALAWKRWFSRADIGPLSGTHVSLGWAFRKESVGMERSFSEWVESHRKSRKYNAIFRSAYGQRNALHTKKRISSLDAILYKHAAPAPYDAPLLMAVAFKESRFQRSVVSPAGAIGLMQLMPATGRRFLPEGTSLQEPEGNLRAGIRYLLFLDRYWEKKGVPADERIHFVLASYNTGPAPVERAYYRAKKEGLDPHRWNGHVEEVLRSPGRRYARETLELADLYRAYLKTGSK